jgi:hypothetical protein
MTSTPWRLGRAWSEAERRAYLAEMTSRPVNFEVSVEQMTPEHGWIVDGVTDVIAHEPPGPPAPDGPFARARQALIHYDFSDPRVVEGHFDPTAPLLGRTMLLEMKVLGVLRFLSGVRVHSVREEQAPDSTRFGFRYDTLVGHFERGFEWFLIEKHHATGTVRCQIEAHWRPGDSRPGGVDSGSVCSGATSASGGDGRPTPACGTWRTSRRLRRRQPRSLFTPGAASPERTD